MLSWVSLVPTLLVLILAIITQSINKALIGGIICASLLASNGVFLTALQLIFTRLYTHVTDGDNIALYLFLITISSLITLLCKTRTIHIVSLKISKKLKTKRFAEYTSLISSFILSIDDYLSILTVGFIMQPLSNTLRIAPSRLAFLVHSLAGPLVILSPLSTWVAAILLQFDQVGIHTNIQNTTVILSDPFLLYLSIIPYLFYPLLTITTVIYIIQTQLTFDKKIKNNRQKPINQENIIPDTNHNLSDIIIPIAILLITVFIGLCYSIGYSPFTNEKTFLQALKAHDGNFIIMTIGSIIAFIIAYSRAMYKKQISITQLGSVFASGVLLIKGAVIMVILASIFGIFVKDDLQTGTYLANTLLYSIPTIFIPLMIFITSGLITLATGSAWGTFALLLPIIIQMLISLQNISLPTTPDTIDLLFPALGAIFSGAVCGDHLSPFSETTIMTATATGITPFYHAYTQFLYIIPTLCITVILFLLSGIAQNTVFSTHTITLPVMGILLLLLLLKLISVIKKHI